MRNIYITISAILFLLFSCKKDALNGEYHVFEGTWDYEFTIKQSATYDTWSGQNIVTLDTIWSTEFSETYSVAFEKKGKLNLFKNNQETNSSRIIFNSFKEIFSNCNLAMDHGWAFEIHLNNDDTNRVIGCISNDTIGFVSQLNLPSEFNDTGSGLTIISYSHIYIKE